MNIAITGTSRGIGLEFVKQWLALGHRVSAVARKPSESPALQRLASPALKIVEGDVTEDSAAHALVAALGDEPLDLLINSAGVYLDRGGLEDLEFDQVRRSFEVNTIAPMRMTRAVLPALARARQPKVVQITSLMGSIADNTSGGYYGYRMSKAALNMFNKSLALDHPTITSVVLHPGWVQTEMGGAAAPVTPEESVRGMIAVILGLSAKDSGKFLEFEGEELPW